MASSDDGKINGRARGDDNINPFISFRRFADEQMSNLLAGIFGMSSRCSLGDYQAWLQEARRSHGNVGREVEEATRIMDIYTRAHEDSAHEELQGAIQDAENPLRCPYRPADQDEPKHKSDRSEGSLAALGVHLPSTILAAPVLGAQVSSVPISYLLYSPYSPVRLEEQRAFRDHEVHWREAFEDLLAVQNGEEITSECEQDARISNTDWVRRMIGLAMCKRDQDKDEECCDVDRQALGIIPGRMVRFTATRQPVNDAYEGEDYQERETLDEESVTELDLYKHFLGKQETQPSAAASSKKPSSAYSEHDSNLAEREGKKPSILSTLTTTERTTLPDGTTHTKVVLKKRFSDGREESTETMSTQNPLPKPQYQPPTQVIGGQASSHSTPVLKHKEKKKVGWFWS